MECPSTATHICRNHLLLRVLIDNSPKLLIVPIVHGIYQVSIRLGWALASLTLPLVLLLISIVLVKVDLLFPSFDIPIMREFALRPYTLS